MHGSEEVSCRSGVVLTEARSGCHVSHDTSVVQLPTWAALWARIRRTWIRNEGSRMWSRRCLSSWSWIPIPLLRCCEALRIIAALLLGLPPADLDRKRGQCPHTRDDATACYPNRLLDTSSSQNLIIYINLIVAQKDRDSRQRLTRNAL